VLVVKLRSIGDTVLATPSLFALRRFLPNTKIDVLLEDWVAPLLEGSDLVDNVLRVGSTPASRLVVARDLRRRGYDVAFNLHGGTTATFFIRASGARHRVGFRHYQYSFLYNCLAGPATQFWQKDKVHSAEQQLALLGSAGVPVDDRPGSRLTVTKKGRTDLTRKWLERGNYALVHPGTAFFTKQWPPQSFARAADFLAKKGMAVVAVGSSEELHTLSDVKSTAQAPVVTFGDLSLPEITALASRARIFVGNDSGMAHIAAAVNTPSVVIFGSSDRDHWRPWTPNKQLPNEIVYEKFHCQPCAGYACDEFGDARCITGIAPEKVFAAIDRVLAAEDSRKF
jgi:lipopolysaccharide heptosyltransferase II